MTTANPERPSDEPPVDRLLRLITAIAVAVLPAILINFVLSYRRAGHDDFWHLLTGSVIAETGTVPKTDPLCFTSDGFVWTNLNWLAQYLSWSVLNNFGWNAAFLVSSLLVTTTVLLTWSALMRRRAHPLLSVLTVILALWTTMNIYGLRPRMWSFALMAALVALVTPSPGERSWPPWRAAAALAIMWLWNQLHGGFVYGYGFLGFVAVGAAFDNYRDRGTLLHRKSLILGGVIAAGLMGFAVHPHGFEALVYAVTYPAQFEPEYFDRIHELQPINFRSRLGFVLEGYLFISAAGLLLSKARLRFEDLIPAIIFLHLSLVVTRGAIPLILITSPWITLLWTEVLAEQKGIFADKFRFFGEWLQPLKPILPVIIGTLALAHVGRAISSPSPAERGDVNLPDVGADWRDLPMARYLTEHPDLGDGGRIFNSYNAGGILGWVLYPERRLLIDGRGDFHSQGNAFTEYLKVIDLQKDWNTSFDNFDIDLVIIEADAPLITVLVGAHNWKTVYDDGRFVIAERGKASSSPPSDHEELLPE